MIKFFMVLAMAALIGATVFAGWNNKVLNDTLKEIDSLRAEYTRLNSDLQEADEKNNNAQVVLEAAQTENQKAKASLSLAQDEMTRKNGQLRQLTEQYDGMKNRLEELRLVQEQMGGRNIEDIQRELQKYEEDFRDLQEQNSQMETQLVAVAAEVERRQDRIGELQEQEIERRKKIALNAMEAMIIAINREHGFVVVNAGSDLGITSDASLLVQRNIDRIGRLRITSVEPSLTVADIVPNSVTPGVQIQVRDKVIFEQVR